MCSSDLPVEFQDVKIARKTTGLDPSTWGPELGLEYESVGQGIETGIVTCGISVDASDPHVYVLKDSSGRYSPDGWARQASADYHALKVNRVAVEKNVGPWVGSILRSVDKVMVIEGV